MDDVTAAVTMVTLEQPELAEQWFTTICQTYDEVADEGDVWAEFTDRFPAAADSVFSSSTARQWVEGVADLTGDPSGLLAELAAQRDDLASLYWAELQEQESASAPDVAGESWETPEEAVYAAADDESGPADPFSWVHAQPGLVDRVESVLQYRPEHYQSHLGPYLEQLWGPGWEQHPDEHKQVWLAQALDGLQTAAEPAQTDVEQQVAGALAEALAEVPEAAELSDEEIAEVLSEVLAEQAASGGA